ncbi:SMEK domain-containing protein [Lyngbya aestuarii]|uniref:SMEK domain-containing protein n=1 Tax=Lyngbya aestuarii TaxID=118322 RepID=UPI00403D7A8D
MNLKQSLDRISHFMSLFVTQVRAETAMGKTDINKVAETVLIPILAEVYGYKELKNLNYTEDSNYPGIDLGDETARVAFQITSTPDSKKVKHTLRKFVENKFYEKYDRLIIYFLTEKQKSYLGKGYKEIIQGKFTFDKDKDIWDYRNILNEVANFQIEKVRKVESILESNFGDGRRQPEWEVIDKVEQIISEKSQLFVGRETESQKLDRFLHENSSGLMLVKARAGFGKTALLANWLKERREKSYFIAYHFFSDRTQAIKSAYRNLLWQLYNYYELSYEQLPSDEEELRIRFYNLLREQDIRENKALIIVIDGLDEAEKPFSPPFPVSLPKNVFVIVSARAEKGEEPKYLEDWTEYSQPPLHLEKLSGGAITNWLQQTSELAAFAEDTSFVAQLDEITEGFPLYLSYLIDELNHAAKQEQDLQAILARTPKGFEQYVEQQLRNIDELELPDERWQFFALLAVAKGILTREDIKALTGMRDRQLRQLHLCWQVTRWMRISEGKLYAFANPLLAKTFGDKLGDDAEDALQHLIDYCAEWQDNNSAYALRYYAEHLRDAKRWEKLYVIARDEDFASTQQQQLPDEPDLPLKTVQTALLGAAEEDKAEIMAEFLLVHAHRLGQTNTQESPLEALRSGSLERALKLADQYELERCVLCYLLLAWELKDTSRREEARETLERLKEKELPRFPNDPYNWQSDYAAYFLAYVFNINKESCTVLVQHILDNYHRRLLCKILSEHGNFDALKKIVSSQEEIKWINYANKCKIAKENENQIRQPDELWTRAFGHAETENFHALLETTAEGIDGLTQIEVLGFIAKGLASKEKTQKARSIFATALQIKQGVEPAFSQAFALADVAVEQVKVEKEVGANTASLANRIAQRINDPTEQAIALARIAEVMAKADKHEEAKIIFDRASEIPQTIQIQQKRVNSFIAIAKAQVRAKKYTDARKSVKLIEYPENKAEVLGAIAKAEAEDGQWEESQITLTTAFEIAERRYMEWERVKILCTIAEAQAVKDKEAAQLTLERARREGTKYLWKIAEAQAKIGEIPNAIQLLNEIEDQWEQIIVLFCIAWTQFKQGEKVSTLDTAVDAKDKIEGEEKREKALKVIARIQAWAGKGEEAVRTAERFLTERNRYLPKVAEVFTETGDKQNFKRLLIPCAYYLDAAYEMCGHLAKLYPTQATDIAKVLKKFTVSST